MVLVSTSLIGSILRVILMIQIRYFIVAGLAFLVFWVLLGKKLSNYLILKRKPKFNPTMLFEIKNSIKTGLIFSLFGALLLYCSRNHYNLLYFNKNDYGLFYFVSSFFILVLLHDAYFYWTHRLMHHKLLFRKFHSTHHMSRNPSPWTSYSFDTGEAFVNGIFLFLASFLVPLHPFIISIFIAFTLIYNVISHLGYELYPRWLKSSFMGTATYHFLHHQKSCYNYGFYFRFWDKLMKTEDPDYKKIVTKNKH